MIIANFIVPFDPITRQTTLPLDKDGQPVKANMWHLAREKGNMVLVQIQAEKEIIDAMKADSASAKPTYRFVETKTTDPLAKEIQSDPEATKTFISKVVDLSTVTKQDWSTPEKSVEAIVKCFDAKLADYQAGGIGVVADVKVDPVIDPKEDPIDPKEEPVDPKEDPVIVPKTDR